MLTTTGVPVKLILDCSNDKALTLAPSFGKPIAFTNDLSEVFRTRRGLGCPDLAWAVTVPPTTYPNPKAASAGSSSQVLSNPAASPIGFERVCPHQSTWSLSSLTTKWLDNAFHDVQRRSATSATLCADSAGRRNRSGRNSALYTLGSSTMLDSAVYVAVWTIGKMQGL